MEEDDEEGDDDEFISTRQNKPISKSGRGSIGLLR